MPRQRHQHRQAIGVVAGAVEPAIDMRVQHNHLGTLAGDHRHRVSRLQSAKRFGLEIDLHAHLVLQTRLHGAVEQRLQEPAIAPADVDARVAAIAEVTRQLVAWQADDVEDADGATLHQSFGSRIDRAALEQHVALRHDQLDGHLALHIDVAKHGGAGRADVDEGRRYGATGNL